MLPVVYLFRISDRLARLIPSVELAGLTYIAAADTGVPDVDDHIVRILQLGDRAIFEFDLVDALQDKGKVLLFRFVHVSLLELVMLFCLGKWRWLAGQS